MSIKPGKLAFVLLIFGLASVLADGDLPIKHENLRAIRVCRDHKTRAEIDEFSLSGIHNKPHTLWRDDQLDLSLVQRHTLVAVQLHPQRGRRDDMDSGFAKRQFDQPLLHCQGDTDRRRR